MGAISVVIVAPIMAPMLVNISRYMAIFILASLSLTYADADPLDVAITLIRPDAIASFIGSPKKTRMGTRMLAPPKPVSDPTKPTGIQTIRSETIPRVKIHLSQRQCAGIYPR